jgi:hypothetical protein
MTSLYAAADASQASCGRYRSGWAESQSFERFDWRKADNDAIQVHGHPQRRDNELNFFHSAIAAGSIPPTRCIAHRDSGPTTRTPFDLALTGRRFSRWYREHGGPFRCLSYP